MWTQTYWPVGGSIAFSALVALSPLVVLAYLLTIRRVKAQFAALATLAMAGLVAVAVYGMPVSVVGSAALMGAAFGLFPIVWIVVNALFIYNLIVATGRFDVIRDSITALSSDRRIQALLVAFVFGTLMESIAGFGTPIALVGAMLVGLGFAAEEALLLALLANTTAVAFGNLGIPVISLAGVVAPLLGERREVLELALSSTISRQIAPLSLVIPAALVLLLAGWRGLRGVWPAALVSGLAFAIGQLVVGNLLGPALAGVLASLASFGALYLLLQVWRPAEPMLHLAHETPQAAGMVESVPSRPPSFGATIDAWLPLLVLVVVVIVGSLPGINGWLDTASARFAWPGLSGAVLKAPPLVSAAQAGTLDALYPAVYVLDWLHAGGSLTLFAGLVSVLITRTPIGLALRVYGQTLKHLRWSALAVASFLAVAWVMNYAGLTATLGLSFTFTGPLFPFFSALVGWLGVFLTGSDTASNNLFGGLQVTTAQQVGVSPLLAAASNSSGGVCGKLISPQNLAIGTAAVNLPGAEGRILRRTVLWSFGLASVVGLMALLLQYVVPGLLPRIG